MPLAHSFVGALGLLIAAVDLAALGLGSMALAVALTLDHLIASWIPTKTLLLGRGGGRAGSCHDFIDDILDLLIVFFGWNILFGWCHLWERARRAGVVFEVEER